MAIDHVLKLYSKTIQSSFLHYGFWDNPSSVDLESMTLQEVKKAQTRYIENLSSFIPEDVKYIFDELPDDYDMVMTENRPYNAKVVYFTKEKELRQLELQLFVL